MFYYALWLFRPADVQIAMEYHALTASNRVNWNQIGLFTSLSPSNLECLSARTPKLLALPGSRVGMCCRMPLLLGTKRISKLPGRIRISETKLHHRQESWVNTLRYQTSGCKFPWLNAWPLRPLCVWHVSPIFACFASRDSWCSLIKHASQCSNCNGALHDIARLNRNQISDCRCLASNSPIWNVFSFRALLQSSWPHCHDCCHRCHCCQLLEAFADRLEFVCSFGKLSLFSHQNWSWMAGNHAEIVYFTSSYRFLDKTSGSTVSFWMCDRCDHSFSRMFPLNLLICFLWFFRFKNTSRCPNCSGVWTLTLLWDHIRLFALLASNALRQVVQFGAPCPKLLVRLPCSWLQARNVGGDGLLLLGKTALNHGSANGHISRVMIFVLPTMQDIWLM